MKLSISTAGDQDAHVISVVGVIDVYTSLAPPVFAAIAEARES
jgi:hypothetical protein